MNLRQIDPSGAYVEAVTRLVVSMMDPGGAKGGLLIPWRTGPDGEVGVPLRLVTEAAGRPVDELEEMLQGQTVMGEDAMFTGRQGPSERLQVGVMVDELCVNLVVLPFIIQREAFMVGGRRCGRLIRLEAASVAELLERLAGVKATV